ncbi:HesB/YadR/YfhF family protein [Neobacillus terrae]|uniref:HesB/YadR/YfhF family protein n=1 Tax=Neobacillus terrae TaxID=3034837 RepID=UPI00140877D8|nr:hypothetical protein [Neobacillus terrae]NHM31805.1 hypothetical protein [Neobacillus terrae]
MLISIDEKALVWFTDEFGINRPFYIRMFPQYAGFGEKHKGYSLAFSAEVPANACFIHEQNGITFYIEGSDTWFFEDTNTSLSYDERIKELLVKYEGVH